MSFQIIINYSGQQNVHAIYIYIYRERYIYIYIEIEIDIDVFQIVHHLFNNLKQHKTYLTPPKKWKIPMFHHQSSKTGGRRSSSTQPLPTLTYWFHWILNPRNHTQGCWTKWWFGLGWKWGTQRFSTLSYVLNQKCNKAGINRRSWTNPTVGCISH